MKAVFAAVMSFLVWLQGAAVNLPTVNPLEIGSCQWATMEAHSIQDFDLTLEGGEQKTITIHLKDGMGLELYVYGDDGELIGSDTESQDTLTVVVPAGTVGWITVLVINTSGESVSMTICVD